MRRLLLIALLGGYSCFSFAAQSAMSTTQATQVKLHTSLGAITLQLFDDKAPETVKNFKTYVQDGFYDGTIFHRVIPGFMAQGGGFTSDFEQKKTRPSIQNEANNGLKNHRGSVAMARTPDPHSATAQFFINYKDNDFLDYTSSTPNGWGYAVFGEVIEGMDVVDQMAKIPTGKRGMFQDVPQQTIVIERAEILR